MKYRNREVKLTSIFIIFSLCFWVKGLSPVYAQFYLPSYYPYQSNAPFTGPFFSQGTVGITNFFNSPQYSMGSNWGFAGNDLYSDIKVMPSFFPGASHTNGMVQGELLVQFTDPYQINQENLMKGFGISEIRPSMSGEFYVVKFSEDHDVREVQKALESLPGIESVEPNLIRRAHTSMPGSYTTSMGGNWRPNQSNTFQMWNSFTPQNSASIYGTQIPFAPQSILNSSFFASYPGFDFRSAW